MRTIRTLIANVLLISAAASFSVATAHADTYSWTNLQSDIAGVATHVDPNLVNPWGMSVSAPNGTIWVSDNGTGVSTLYGQDGTARSAGRRRSQRLRGTEEEAIPLDKSATTPRSFK